eukprot:COSAG05_NODE_2878_length_2550_cov_3.736882_4_plen_127_part_01
MIPQSKQIAELEHAVSSMLSAAVRLSTPEAKTRPKTPEMPPLPVQERAKTPSEVVAAAAITAATAEKTPAEVVDAAAAAAASVTGTTYIVPQTTLRTLHTLAACITWDMGADFVALNPGSYRPAEDT